MNIELGGVGVGAGLLLGMQDRQKTFADIWTFLDSKIAPMDLVDELKVLISCGILPPWTRFHELKDYTIDELLNQK
jgi:hypothetical protein